MATPHFSLEELHRRYRYDPDTGFFWRLPSDDFKIFKAPMCRLLGSTNSVIGYVTVGACRQHFWAHRLAWFYVHGMWPAGEIDHINGERSDNRIANLRDTGRQENAQNMRRANSANKAGFLGVSEVKSPRRKGRAWQATIKVGGTRHYLGCFPTPELAHTAYLVAKRRLHAGCTI